ncbi:peptidoglycan recognition protein family protein [Streptomyces sp. 1331.2]|uniref:peptidoglycan recognition protein family protein n=1 Tax=Streptomyces sp. 1331.2 TaxID=1938835 RepID=UPI000BE442B3|nr:N-acetylmuramoyl-L-alanine amidase [Streptomyces sp. 1331.2]
MPGAVWRPVRNYTPHGRTEQRGLVLHVQAGNNSPYGWFDDEESEASSDFWVSKSGRIEQYVDTGNDRAWAQGAGNRAYASVETEGHPDEPLTPEQIEGVARIYAWGAGLWAWPLQVIDSTTERGLTFHGAGGAAWGGHPDCPGEIRKAQRGAILARAAELLGAPAQPTPPAVPSYPSWPGRYISLRSPYMRGDDVRQWQQRMRARGWSIDVDGIFGPQSAGVAHAFQSEKGLDTDSIIGPATWAAAWTAPLT